MAAMVLLTGASGYIGSRLLRVLEEGGCAVRCLARQPERVAAGRATTEVVAGDCLDEASLVAAMDGVDQAYYLVHSMASGPGFAALDRQAAANFGRAAARAGVRRIIYLGGLGDDPRFPVDTSEEPPGNGRGAARSGVPVVEFRASIVIGAGSLSFEMIRALVERLPVMICPRWVDTRTQPIAIDDVLAYLRAALDLPDGRGGVFEIGGPEVVSYGEMMREYAQAAWAATSADTGAGADAAAVGAVARPGHAGAGARRARARGRPAQSHRRAFAGGARDIRDSCRCRCARPSCARSTRTAPLSSRSTRAWSSSTRRPRRRSRPFDASAAPPGGISAMRCGGCADGSTAALGGAGMPRHRRDPDACAVGDVIDGWRVEAYEPDRLLRLAAGLKLPGRGWLEFRVAPLGDGARSLIRQTATFDPRGVAGRLYWYGVLPLHALIFRGLLRRIARRAGTGRRARAPVDLHVLLDHRRASGRGVPLARAAGSARGADSRGAGANRGAGGRHPRRRARHAVDRHRPGTCPLGGAAPRLHRRPAILRRAGARSVRASGGTRICSSRSGHSQTLYQDRIEFAVSRRGALNRFAAAVLRPGAHARLRAPPSNRAGQRRPRASSGRAPMGGGGLLWPPRRRCSRRPLRAQTPAPVRTVPFVDLDRYAGDWFEIARFPNRFQRQCVGDVRASYARRPDGRLDVVNRCRTADGQTEARGVARIVDERTFARLKVRFAPAWLSWLPLVWGDYWIIGLAADYSWAVVGDRRTASICGFSLARRALTTDRAAAARGGRARQRIRRRASRADAAGGQPVGDDAEGRRQRQDAEGLRLLPDRAGRAQLRAGLRARSSRRSRCCASACSAAST